MATIGQIRGMLLEEAVLHLLTRAGYNTVDKPGTDKTLTRGPAGLEVKGRGCDHQIDAIADFAVVPPFVRPQRLLVEAKCYSKRVGVDVIRNAVGVLKDVSEYFLPVRKSVASRYHYQYAVFSATDFSEPAQSYAFAQDIYLLPLAQSAFLQPLLRSIEDTNADDFGRQESPNGDIAGVNLSQLRSHIRSALRESYLLDASTRESPSLNAFLKASQTLEAGLVGMIARRFPVFLVSAGDVRVETLETEEHVQIVRRVSGWFIRKANRDLFSFDLPPVLFELYRDSYFRQKPTSRFKEDFLSEIQATVRDGSHVRIVTFRLDREWLDRVSQNKSASSTKLTDHGIEDGQTHP